MLCYTAAEDCGGNYTEESGTIDYPPGDSNYGKDEHCVWNVQLPDSDDRIVVNVTEFQIEDDSTCAYDYLEVSIYPYLPGNLTRMLMSELYFSQTLNETTKVCFCMHK